MQDSSPCKRRVGEPTGGQARGPARGGDRAISPVPAGSASSSPLEALEACLKGIPLSGSLPPQPPATSWFRSPQPGDPGSQRPELQPRGSHSQGSLGRGLRAAFIPAKAQGGDHAHVLLALGLEAHTFLPTPPASPLLCLPPNSSQAGWRPVDSPCPLPCRSPYVLTPAPPDQQPAHVDTLRLFSQQPELPTRRGDPSGRSFGPRGPQWLFP